MAAFVESKWSVSDGEKSIGAGEFKAKCLKLLDEVAETGEPLVVTKFGKPVAKIVPMPERRELFGALKGTVLWEGNIISPMEGVWDLDERTDELVNKIE